jgi:cytochrome c biogenesis protein CcmG/thiol:disulfide interchange protein DsbE
MKRFALPLGIFLILLVFLGIGLRLKPQEIPSPFIGKPAPAFTLTLLHDAQKSFSPKDMLGKVWVLNVWASWCAPCRAELPALMALTKAAAIPIVGLNYTDTRSAGNKWLASFGNPYQLSAFDADGKVGIDYGVYGVPETFVIDKSGFIRLKHAGPVTEDDIKEKFLPLLKELSGG